MAYQVGPLVEGDAQTLGPLHNRLWQATYAGLLPGHVLAARDDCENTRRWAERGAAHEQNGVGAEGATTWVARDEELTPVGWISLGPARDPKPPASTELWSLYVDAAHQGSGVARQLLEVGLPTGPLYLWVLEGNERAVAFYRKVGFEHDGGSKPFGTAGGRELRMVRG